MAYKALLNEINKMIEKEIYDVAPVWYDDNVINDDIKWIEERVKDTKFDVLRLSEDMYSRVGKDVKIISKKCKYGRVIKLQVGEKDHTPWELWARILRLFGLKNVRIIFFAHPNKRLFPSSIKEQLGPEHINGGYCNPCNPNTVVIYRDEDSTRVLIHELLHAACTDDRSKNIEDIEAETEAWAELFLAQLVGGPNGWRKQRIWMSLQDLYLSKWGIKKGSYIWRYTIGKEAIWDRWGFPHLGNASFNFPKNSLKLGAYL
jgi:hypothetical protein